MTTAFSSQKGLATIRAVNDNVQLLSRFDEKTAPDPFLSNGKKFDFSLKKEQTDRFLWVGCGTVNANTSKWFASGRVVFRDMSPSGREICSIPFAGQSQLWPTATPKDGYIIQSLTTGSVQPVLRYNNKANVADFPCMFLRVAADAVELRIDDSFFENASNLVFAFVLMSQYP